MRPAFAALALAATLALAGCKTDLAITLQVTDLQAARGGEQGRTATAVIGVEALRCPQQGPAALAAVRVGFPEAEFIGCRDGGFETFAQYRVRLPIVPLEKATPADAALAVRLDRAEGETDLAVTLPVGWPVVDQMTRALPETLRAGLDLGTAPSVSLVVRNDGGEDWTLRPQGVFIDGKSAQMRVDITLAPRDEVQITLSDVGAHALTATRAILFFVEP